VSAGGRDAVWEFEEGERFEAGAAAFLEAEVSVEVAVGVSGCLGGAGDGGTNWP
jgi:hypothetical protein